MRRYATITGIICLTFWLVACQEVKVEELAYDPTDLRFSGERALAIEEEFVGKFPNRASGEVENRKAAKWLEESLGDIGFDCFIDDWEVINYSRIVPLNNVVCELPGESQEEIILLAHLDQSPFTVEGADDGGSGVAVLVHMAEIIAQEKPWPYSVSLVITDGSVYGGLGARRLVESHPDLERIVAAIVLDNLGHELYEGLSSVPVGQFAGYGSLEIQLVAQEAARGAAQGAAAIQDGGWIPRIPELFTQIRDQIAPLSIDDQGPLVANRLPTIGLVGWVPVESEGPKAETLFSPLDSLSQQSAEVLQKSGLAAEGLVRQLQTLDKTPTSRAPYLYFAESEQQLRPGFIILILTSFVFLFFLASYFVGRKVEGGYLQGIVSALPHFLGFWLPILASVFILYLFVAIGLIDEYDVYPATFNDPAIKQPQVVVLLLWAIALWELLQIGRRLTGLYLQDRSKITFTQVKSLGLLIVGLGAGYVLMVNPMSVILLFPLVAWLFISGRHGRGKLLDIVMLLLGASLVVIFLIYLGFQVLGNSIAIFWYFLLLISIRTISFSSIVFITAIIAAGLSLVILPLNFNRTAEEQVESEDIVAPSAPSNT